LIGASNNTANNLNSLVRNLSEQSSNWILKSDKMPRVKGSGAKQQSGHGALRATTTLAVVK